MDSGLTLDDGDLRVLRSYWEVYERHAAEIQERTRVDASSIPAFAKVFESMTPEQMAEQDEKSLRLMRGAIVDENWEPYLSDLRQQGVNYAKMGVAFGPWFDIIRAFRKVIVEIALREETRSIVDVLLGIDVLIDVAMGVIGEAYIAAKQDIILAQQEAIREISTPVLQVRERLLILPIVGMVDTHRARLLTEALLGAIRDRRARAVVMDVTGVPVVDSKVANHLIQSVQAAKLMGATVIVTGVSPEIAQTLVMLGIDLGGVPTVGDLQGGIESAERLLAERGARDASTR